MNDAEHSWGTNKALPRDGPMWGNFFAPVNAIQSDTLSILSNLFSKSIMCIYIAVSK